MTKCERDIIGFTAPQPFVIVQIRISFGATAASAVTRRTVFAKRWLADSAGEVEQLRIGDDFRQRSGRQFVHQRPTNHRELPEIFNHCLA